MKKKYNPYLLPPWLQYIRGVAEQLIIPFTIFQGIRTLLISTAFDVILLAVFVLIAAGFYLDYI